MQSVLLMLAFADNAMLLTTPPLKPAEQPPYAANFAALKAESDKLVEARDAPDSTAKTEAEKQALVVRRIRAYRLHSVPLAAKAVALAREHVSDERASEILIWIISLYELTPASGEAVDLLLKHHANNPKLLKIQCEWYSPAADKLFRGMAAAELGRTDKGRALFRLAEHLQHKANGLRLLVASPPVRVAQWEASLGRAYLERIRALDPAPVEEEAVRLFTELGQEYGEIKVGSKSLDEAAKTAVFGIRNLRIGAVAPDIVGEEVDGTKLKLSDHRGKVVVLSFWASWCGGCMRMVPHERALVDRMKGRPFALVGVNGDEDRAKAKEVVKAQSIIWQSFWDAGPGGAIATHWNVPSWPTIYILDHTRVIRGMRLWGTALDQKVDELVREAEAASRAK